MDIHDTITDQIAPGDKIIYHGNYTGYGKQSAECIDEILTFRRMILAMRGMMPHDLVYLRGAQEEMLQKLLQLQFAPNPLSVMMWMLENGLAQTLESYGIHPQSGIEACGQGVMALTKWTENTRQIIKSHPGHDIFQTQLQRAAFTEDTTEYPMLFVHSGLNADLPLIDQGDNFWWASHDFDAIETAYKPYEKVVRGYDPGHRGVHLNCITATIDGGCGFGGSLVCAQFDQDGSVTNLYES